MIKRTEWYGLLDHIKEQEAEFARLKGEYDAIHQSAVLKKCPDIITPQPSVTAEKTAIDVVTEVGKWSHMQISAGNIIQFSCFEGLE